MNENNNYSDRDQLDRELAAYIGDAL
ncbi:MAG: hypothetical protein ACJAUG_000549, partial [Halioglobus sp.]